MNSALKPKKSLESLPGPRFLIYINNVPQQVEQCELFGYADDYNFVATDLANHSRHRQN